MIQANYHPKGIIAIETVLISMYVYETSQSSILLLPMCCSIPCFRILTVTGWKRKLKKDIYWWVPARINITVFNKCLISHISFVSNKNDTEKSNVVSAARSQSTVWGEKLMVKGMMEEIQDNSGNRHQGKDLIKGENTAANSSRSK